VVKQVKVPFHTVVALALVAVSTTACAVDMSKADFVRRVDAICERVAEATKPTALQLFEMQPTASELADFSGQLVPILERGLLEARDLEPPEGDERPVNVVLAAWADEIARFKAFGAEAAAGDQMRTDDFMNSVPFANFKRRAGQYGLTGCALERNGKNEAGVTAEQRAAFPAGRKEFIEKADALCEKHSRAPANPLYFQNFSYYRDLSRDPPPLELWGALLGRGDGTGTGGSLVPYFQKEVEALRAVGAPEPDKASLTRILGGYDGLAANAEEAGNRARAGDRMGFRNMFAEVAAGSASLDKALSDYGVTKCALSELLLIGRVSQDTFRLP